MTQLDPFIIYTVKLAMDFKSVQEEPTTPIPTRSSRPPFEKTTTTTNQEQDNFTNPMFPGTMARIMTMKSYSLKSGEKIPKLRRDNILSLLYHADEQWSNSSSDLSTLIQSNGSQVKVQYAVEHVHHQQRIYLDTLHLLHKAIFPNETQRRYNEPIWFAAQVLNSQCQIRHLEYFTELISPLAKNLHESIEHIRYMTRRLLQKQQVVKQRYIQQHQKESIFSSFISNFISSDTINSNYDDFYTSEEHTLFLKALEPYLAALSYHWSTFEKTLYECYVHTVFGKYHTHLIMEEHQKSNALSQEILLQQQQQQQQQQLPNELFHDHFTQLLPIILERAINLHIIDIQSIQSLDPIAFVAIPRLAILAGVTWLAHLTGWRTNQLNNLPVWIKSHVHTLRRITLALDQLEIQLLKNQSQDAHHSFVTRYQTLEQALVSGRSIEEGETICERLEKDIFLDICMVADSILSSHRAQAFTIVLCHLFRHFGLQYDIEFEESEDAVPLDQTMLDLAI